MGIKMFENTRRTSWPSYRIHGWWLNLRKSIIQDGLYSSIRHIFDHFIKMQKDKANQLIFWRKGSWGEITMKTPVVGTISFYQGLLNVTESPTSCAWPHSIFSQNIRIRFQEKLLKYPEEPIRYKFIEAYALAAYISSVNWLLVKSVLHEQLFEMLELQELRCVNQAISS